MVLKIVQNEVNNFYEQNRYALYDISSKFEGFGKRLSRFLKDHIQKRAIILTARAHPGEP